MTSIGFGLPVAGEWATPEALRFVARRAEELGYASLWTFQRILATDKHPSVLDAITPLAYVAGHTSTIRLGTATVCAPYTPPALLAKTMTTLDILSGGRLTVGVGMGWMREEYAAAGVPYTRRGARMDEYLRCLKALWTQDPVEFAGEFYTVPRSRQRPGPVQRPHPPLLYGGSAPAGLRRAGRLADGWICSSEQDLGDLADRIATVQAAAGGPTQVLVRVTTEAALERAMATPGVTEVLLDLNMTPGTTLEQALEVLTRLRPSA